MINNILIFYSSDLLRSFMEDLEAFTNDVLDAKTPDQMKDISERILSLIQVILSYFFSNNGSYSRIYA